MVGLHLLLIMNHNEGLILPSLSLLELWKHLQWTQMLLSFYPLRSQVDIFIISSERE
jgi:hypothetical protein